MITPVSIVDSNLDELKTSFLFTKSLQNRAVKAKKTLHDWSRNCTFHCYPKIFEYENTAAKLAWLAIFLGFTGITGYLVAKGFLDYFDYEVVSQIALVNEAQVDFPAVTICTTNAFSTKQGEAFMESMWLETLGREITNLTTDEILAYYSPVYGQAKYEAASSLYNDSFRQKLGIQLMDTIQSCEFSALPCDLKRDFRWFYSYSYGNCIQFNSGFDSTGHRVNLKTTTFQGEENGLALNLGPLVNGNKKYLTTQLNGLKIYIHEPAYEPNFFDSATSILMGKETSIGLKRTLSTNLPRPYSECKDSPTESDLYRLDDLFNMTRKIRKRTRKFIL